MGNKRIQSDQTRYYTEKDIGWDEKKGAIVLPNQKKYRIVVTSEGKNTDVKSFDKKEQKKLVDNIRRVFKESDFKFKDLDGVRISKGTLMAGEKRIGKLKKGRLEGIFEMFKNMILLFKCEPGVKPRKAAEEKPYIKTDGKVIAKKQPQKSGQIWQQYFPWNWGFVSSIERNHGLKYHAIYGGGNCLFSAALTGLQKVGKAPPHMSVSDFRNQVVEKLKESDYRDRILLQMLNDVCDIQGKKGELNYYGNSLLRTLYEAIVAQFRPGEVTCDDIQLFASSLGLDPVQIYLESMGTNGIYGSDLELAAIQDLYGVPIRLFNENFNEGYLDRSSYDYDTRKNNLHLLFSSRHYDLFVLK